MSIKSPVIRSVVSQAVRAVLGVSDTIQRNITLLDSAVSSSFGGFQVSLSGSWSIEVVVNRSSLTGAVWGLQNNGNAEYLVLAESAGDWYLDTNTKTPDVSGTAITADDIFDKTRVVWDGTDFKFYINDSLIYTSVPTSTAWVDGDYTLCLGQSGVAADHISGDVLSAEIWNNTDQSGTSAHDYDLSGDWVSNNIVPDLGTAGGVGVDGVKNGEFTLDLSDWTDVNSAWQWVAGRAYHALSDVFNHFRQAVSMTPGEQVVVRFGLEIPQGRVRVQWRDAAHNGIYPYVATIDATGDYAMLTTVPTNAVSLLFARDSVSIPTEFYLDNVSVEAAPGHGTAVNISAAMAELYELNIATSPDQWESTESAKIIPIGY